MSTSKCNPVKYQYNTRLSFFCDPISKVSFANISSYKGFRRKANLVKVGIPIFLDCSDPEKDLGY